MTLQFAKEINGNKTHFKKKILKSFTEYLGYDYKQFGLTNYTSYSILPKRHTIRNYDTKFKKGTKIHFKQWKGRPYYSDNENFAPIIEVKSIQSIKILEYLMTASETSFQMPDGTIYVIEVDGFRLDKKTIHTLAINDGFFNEVEFFRYLKGNFNGKIIHWTSLKY